MATLTLHGLVKRFGERVVLDGVDLAVRDGEFLVLVGPSGCGKSTLLRIVAGLVEADAGTVAIDARRVDELEPRERDVAMVFQNYALYPHMSVLANIAFPLRMAGVRPRERKRRAREVADTLGLTEHLAKKPGKLSGGQMQRVALGRALVRDPAVFLFDEPLSNLDARLRAEMRGELARMHERLGVTSLYVTHDQAEAMTLGARVAVLNEGRLEQLGTPREVYGAPATLFVASFMGSPPMNLLTGAVRGGVFRAGGLELAAPAQPDGDVVLGVRPHELRCVPGGDATIAWAEHLGSETHVGCDAGGGVQLRVALPGDTALAPGARVAFAWSASALHWFETRTGLRREQR
jgi:ABC-type sugar transport system ATPase subunit